MTGDTDREAIQHRTGGADSRPSRRRFLRVAAGVGVLSAVAGCSGGGGGGDGDDGGATTTTTERTPTATDTATSGTTEQSSPTETETSSSGGTLSGTKLSAPDGAPGDEFGFSVAVSDDGSTAIVSAPEDEGGGSAHVFTRSEGTWSQQTKLAPQDGESNDFFGFSVALSADGGTALVGAYFDEVPAGRGAGSVYVFSRSGGSWSRQAKLTAEDGDRYDRSGWSVALSGDGSTAVVGAPQDEDPNGERAGSAYVFSGSGESWSQRAKLVPDDGDADDQFGYSVAVSDDGSTAIVGAVYDEDPNGPTGGSAYVFSGSGGSWSQQAKVAPEGDEFGWSVELSSDGTTAVLGAPGGDENGTDAGAAHVISRSGGSWSQQAKLLADDGDSTDNFGWSVSLSNDGSTTLVGADQDEDPNGRRSGSAYVHSESGGSWSQRAKLVPDDGDEGDHFGFSVALSGDGSTTLVGADQDEDPNGESAGSAYVFE